MNKSESRDHAAAAPVIEEMRRRHPGGYAALRDRLVRAVRGYFAAVQQESGATVLVVGLSGGVDSALVTFLAVQAVGCSRVLPVTLPAWQDTAGIDRAAKVRSALGYESPHDARFIISIEKVVEAHVAAINSTGVDRLQLESNLDRQSDLDRLRVGNFAARSRVAVFYDLAQAYRGRVLGTGNRTEFVQGYSAKFGTPISYDYGVLDDLYKVDVYELARLVGVPEEIQSAIPTTGYYPGQTHEDELGMSLDVQDALAYLLFERGEDPGVITAERGFSRASVQLLQDRYARFAHKRKLQPEHIQLIDGR